MDCKLSLQVRWSIGEIPLVVSLVRVVLVAVGSELFVRVSALPNKSIWVSIDSLKAI